MTLGSLLQRRRQHYTALTISVDEPDYVSQCLVEENGVGATVASKQSPESKESTSLLLAQHNVVSPTACKNCIKNMNNTRTMSQ
jgi:hypothetical protein